jgi:molecular chaperone GrpE
MTNDEKKDEEVIGGRESVVGENPTTTNNQQTTTEELQAKCDEYLSGWKRALADYENAKKAAEQNKAEEKRRVRMNVADDLLPVVDNFGYVTKHVPDTSDCSDDFKKKFDTWFKGIEHIDRQFTEALKGLGVEPIEAVGK